MLLFVSALAGVTLFFSADPLKELKMEERSLSLAENRIHSLAKEHSSVSLITWNSAEQCERPQP